MTETTTVQMTAEEAAKYEAFKANEAKKKHWREQRLNEKPIDKW